MEKQGMYMKKKLLYMFTVLFLFSNLVFGLTRGEIRTGIRYKIRDTTDTLNNDNPRWTDGILNQRINNAQDFIVGYTHCLYDKYLISPVTGQSEYNLPPGWTTIDRVSYMHTTSTSGYKKLTQSEQVNLDRDMQTWEIRTAGYPMYYYIRGSSIGIVPKPSGGYSHANALKIEYYKKPTDLTADTDIPFDGFYNLYIWHDLIECKVTAECLEDENKTTQADYLWKRFFMLLEIMKTETRWKPDYNPQIKFNFSP